MIAYVLNVIHVFVLLICRGFDASHHLLARQSFPVIQRQRRDSLDWVSKFLHMHLVRLSCPLIDHALVPRAHHPLLF